ncbi:hypothetical protein AB4Z50_13530 [Paenibacillus sp. 2TAB26]|uniref:hypothetical protein n=1 Tax=Paenibacillus sp. 2TAB26 TaxID=3233005 RepID=UPI003F974039
MFSTMHILYNATLSELIGMVYLLAGGLIALWFLIKQLNKDKFGVIPLRVFGVLMLCGLAFLCNYWVTNVLVMLIIAPLVSDKQYLLHIIQMVERLMSGKATNSQFVVQAMTPTEIQEEAERKIMLHETEIGHADNSSNLIEESNAHFLIEIENTIFDLLEVRLFANSDTFSRNQILLDKKKGKTQSFGAIVHFSLNEYVLIDIQPSFVEDKENDYLGNMFSKIKLYERYLKSIGSKAKVRGIIVTSSSANVSSDIHLDIIFAKYDDLYNQLENESTVSEWLMRDSKVGGWS